MKESKTVSFRAGENVRVKNIIILLHNSYLSSKTYSFVLPFQPGFPYNKIKQLFYYFPTKH